MAGEVKKAALGAVIVTAVLLALNYLMSFLGYPVQQLYSSIGPVSAISGTLGQKVLGWIGGILPVGQLLGLGTIAVAISAFLVILVGTFMVDKGIFGMKFPAAKGKTGRVASIIVWGTAVFYVLVVGLVMKSWGVLVGLAIHTVILAFVTGFIADKFNVNI
jgi:hypothetical protein